MRNLKKIIKSVIYNVNKNPLSKALYKQEIDRRAKLPLTDIEPLSKHINMFAPFTNELQPVNDWYGHATILKKFLGLPQTYKFKFIIEHGTYFADQVADIELESNLPSFITYSPYRAKVLKKYKKNTYAIGPLIHYASTLLSSKELTKEKKRMGKTLLFFPSHSLIGLTNEFDNEWSYRKIKATGKNFDTIRICVYWKDVLLNKHKFYQDKGFECVTAGHILDPNFLPRLKSILYTSDLTVSNDASSPLNYSIYMKKPHIIFYQRPKMTGKYYFKKVMNDYWKSKHYHKVVKEFSQVRYSISFKQKELMDYYCGIKNVKGKKELLRIVEATENIHQNKHLS